MLVNAALGVNRSDIFDITQNLADMYARMGCYTDAEMFEQVLLKQLRESWGAAGGNVFDAMKC